MNRRAATVVIVLLLSVVLLWIWYVSQIGTSLLKQDEEFYAQLASRMAHTCAAAPVDGRLVGPSEIGKSVFPELERFHPAYGLFFPTRGYIECGGGHHHYGFTIRLEEERPKTDGAAWLLHYDAESSTERLLYKLLIPREGSQ